MTLSPEEIDIEYAAALADAGIDRGRARLYVAKGMGKRNIRAVWHRPGVELVLDEQFPDRSQLTDANAPQHRDLHRIVAPAEGTDPVTLAALLRHELEHGRQYDALGERILDLQDFIENEVLPYKAGSLDGCAGGLINAIPTEVDCNAAASVYVDSRFSSEDLDSLRGSDLRQLAAL